MCLFLSSLSIVVNIFLKLFPEKLLESKQPKKEDSDMDNMIIFD